MLDEGGDVVVLLAVGAGKVGPAHVLVAVHVQLVHPRPICACPHARTGKSISQPTYQSINQSRNPVQSNLIQSIPRGREGGYRRGRAARRRITRRRPGARSAGCKEHASGLGARSFLPRMNMVSGWEHEGVVELLDLVGREGERRGSSPVGGGGGEAVRRCGMGAGEGGATVLGVWVELRRREVADTGRNGDGGRGGRTQAGLDLGGRRGQQRLEWEGS